MDIDALMKLRPKFSAAIALNWGLSRPTRLLQQYLLDKNLSLEDIEPLVRSDPEKYGDPDMIKHLSDHDLLVLYLKYQADVTHGSMSMNLRYATNYKFKHMKEFVAATPADQSFPFLYEWLDKQDIFEEYGRVNINLTEPHVPVVTHLDPPNDQVKDQFVWIQLDGRQKLYLLDDDGTRHYVDGHCVWFDAQHIFHGLETPKFAGWGLRIDGTFSQSFLEKTGLDKCIY